METFVPSSVRPGVHKSWAPGHRGLQISLLWRIKLVLLRNGTCFLLPAWGLQFWDGATEKFVNPNRVFQAFVRSRDRSIVIHENKMTAHILLRSTRTRNLEVKFKNVPWTLIWVDLNCCSTKPLPLPSQMEWGYRWRHERETKQEKCNTNNTTQQNKRVSITEYND